MKFALASSTRKMAAWRKIRASYGNWRGAKKPRPSFVKRTPALPIFGFGVTRKYNKWHARGDNQYIQLQPYGWLNNVGKGSSTALQFVIGSMSSKISKINTIISTTTVFPETFAPLLLFFIILHHMYMR